MEDREVRTAKAKELLESLFKEHTIFSLALQIRKEFEDEDLRWLRHEIRLQGATNPAWESLAYAVDEAIGMIGADGIIRPSQYTT